MPPHIANYHHPSAAHTSHHVISSSPVYRISRPPCFARRARFAQVTSKYIASNVRKARLINLVGLAGASNVQGEDQKKLDLLSNDIMMNALRASGKCSVMVSEEVDDAILIGGSKGT